MGKENIKENHIKFAYLIKWLDSLASPMESPSVATEIAMGRRTKKRKRVWKKIWSHHHSYSGKLWKTIKIRQVCEKLDFGSGSRLRVGKVLAPYNARQRAVPLI